MKLQECFVRFKTSSFVVLGFNFPNSRCFKIENEKNTCSSTLVNDYFLLFWHSTDNLRKDSLHFTKKIISFHFPSSICDRWCNNTIKNDRKSIYILWKSKKVNSNRRKLYLSTFSSTGLHFLHDHRQIFKKHFQFLI